VAISTKTVDGKVVGISGAGAGPGSIKVTPLPLGGHVDDAGTEQVVGTIGTFLIAANGDVNFELIPTEAIAAPSGGSTVYKFEYENGGAKWTDYVELFNADTDPINIGDLTRVAAPAPGVGTRWPRYTEATKPAKNASNAGRPYRVKDPGGNEYAEIILEDSVGAFEYVPFASF